MSPNAVHNRLIQLSKEVTFQDFMGYLFRSTADLPIRVKWRKMNGAERYVRVYWDTSAYRGTPASLTKQMNDQINLQCIDADSDWKTVDLKTVKAFSWFGVYYTIK